MFYSFPIHCCKTHAKIYTFCRGYEKHVNQPLIMLIIENNPSIGKAFFNKLSPEGEVSYQEK